MAKLRRFSQELSLGQVDIAFMQRYVQHLSLQLSNSMNSISKSVRIIKTILAAASKQGMVNSRQLEGFAVAYSAPRREHLSLTELKRFARYNGIPLLPIFLP